MSKTIKSTEFIMLMYFLLVLTFNKWLGVPEKSLDLMALFVAAFTGIRQYIKRNGGK
jgi:hypothetical protein